MSTYTIPNAHLSSVQEARDYLKEFAFANDAFPASSLKVTSSAELVVQDDQRYPLSTLAFKPLLTSVGLPTKNLDVLPFDRIADDLNALFKDNPSTLWIRFSNRNVYDVIKTAKELQPISPTQFIEGLALGGPADLKDHAVDFVRIDGGQVHIRTRQVRNPIEVAPGDMNFVGLQFKHRDYRRHDSSVAYHVYRTACTNSAVDISSFTIRHAYGDDSKLGALLSRAREMMDNSQYVRQAYLKFKDESLNEYSFNVLFNSLSRRIGLRAAQDVLQNYMTIDPTDLKERRRIYNGASIQPSLYEVMNHITSTAKSFENPNDVHDVEGAVGALLTEYATALQNTVMSSNN